MVALVSSEHDQTLKSRMRLFLYLLGCLGRTHEQAYFRKANENLRSVEAENKSLVRFLTSLDCTKSGIFSAIMTGLDVLF